MILMLILLFVIIGIFNSLAFDRIIEYQYERYHDEWKMDGKPRGMFFNPVGGSVLGFWVVSFRLGVFTFKQLPSWAEDDLEAISLFSKFKFWNKITMYYLVLFFPLLILSKILF